MKQFKTILYIHIAASILAVLILIIIPWDDRLRWNIGYIIRWTVPVSALFLMFFIPREYPNKKKKNLKLYLKIFWGLPIATGIITAFFWIFGLAYLFLLSIAFIPNASLIEQGEYVIRQEQSMRVCYILYQRQGLLEVKKEEIGGQGGMHIKKDTIEVSWYEDNKDLMNLEKKSLRVHSLSYDEPNHRIFFHCADTTIIYPPEHPSF